MKDSLDRFYTSEVTAKECFNEALFFLEQKDWDRIIEPSCGGGAFLNLMIDRFKGTDAIGFDLDPSCVGVKELGAKCLNWFDYVDEYKPSGDDMMNHVMFGYELPSRNVAVIGNPPFGKRNDLSRRFIEHSIYSGATLIAMILPSVYEKHTLQRSFPPNWKLLHNRRLPKNSFVFNGEPYNVHCSFQIWSCMEFSCSDLRWDQPPRVTSGNFKFCIPTKFESGVAVDWDITPDFFILGASCSTMKSVDDVSSTNRGYYLKDTCGKLKEALSSINWSDVGCGSVSGNVSWITKPELVKHIDEYLS